MFLVPRSRTRVVKWAKIWKLLFCMFSPKNKWGIHIHSALFYFCFFFWDGISSRLFYLNLDFFGIFFLCFRSNFQPSQTSRYGNFMFCFIIYIFKCYLTGDFIHCYNTTSDFISLVFKFLRTCPIPTLHKTVSIFF